MLDGGIIKTAASAAGRLRLWILSIMAVILTAVAAAAATASSGIPDTGESPAPDSIAAEASPALPTPKKGFFPEMTGRFKRYLDESNKPKDFDKKIDFSVIGGPHYSSETKFGLGIVAAANYRSDRSDSITTPSFTGLYGDITTSGSWYLGVKGMHLFPADRRRIDYALGIGSTPSDFWGIGYQNGNNSDNKTKYDNFYFTLRANFMWRLARGFYLGPGIEADYFQARHVDRPELWDGQRLRTTTFGVSLKIQIDTRDNLTFPRSGWLVALSGLGCPKFLGNHYAFTLLDLNTCHYRAVWKGGILAGQLHTAIGFGDIPWGMLPTFGGSESVRGYYAGRYRDKREADLTVELRQHVWKRSSIAVWVGAATVFNRPDELRLSHILPNGGIGYRWEFKKNTNVRLDLGFGRHSTGFVFSINEAF